MLAAMGPQMQKYLWWKKYLTALQMVIFRSYSAYVRVKFDHSNVDHILGSIYLRIHSRIPIVIH